MTASDILRTLLLSAALGCCCSSAQAQSKQADALSARAERLYKSGQYAEALPLAQQALSTAERSLGRDSWRLAQSVNDLAQIDEKLGKLGDAEHAYARAVALYEKWMGPNHPYVATALVHLADVYEQDKRGKDAEPLYRRALAIREKALGASDVEVANTLTKLGLHFQHAGKLADAEPLFRRALAIREHALAPDSIDIAFACENLGVVLAREGHSTEAEPLLQRALAIRQKTLGPDDPTVAIADRRLAWLYVQEKRFSDAEPLDQRALAIQQKALGPDDIRLADTLIDLAKLSVAEKHYGDAEPLFQRALAIRLKQLGPDHPDVAAVQNELGILYFRERRYAEAEGPFKQALTIDQKRFGSDDLRVAAECYNLASTYRNEVRYPDAERLYKRSLSIREKLLGPDHAEVADALTGLAALYREEGRYVEAEPLFKRGLAIRERTAGLDGPDFANALSHLARLYQEQSRYADAEPLFERALKIREKAFGANNAEVGQAMVNVATIYDGEGRYSDAQSLYERALAIVKMGLGPENANFAVALNNLAVVYREERRYADAESLSKQAVTIDEKVLSRDDPGLAVMLNNLAVLYDRQGRYVDAEPLYKRALAIWEKSLGLDHPNTAKATNHLALLYANEHRFAQALPLIQAAIIHNVAFASAALPVLAGAENEKLIPADEALDDSLNVIERAQQTAAAQALNALAVRFSAGSSRLAQLVRQDQDLAGEAAVLDKALLAAVSKESSQATAASEQQIRDRVAAVSKQRGDLAKVLAQEFPDYAALANPEPLTVKDIQSLLADDEALVVVDLGAKSYVWAVTHDAVDWKELSITAAEASKDVAALRAQLDFYNVKPFDPQPSFALYQKILAPVADLLRGKPRVSFVLNGALTSLPPQLLVTSDPSGKALKDVDWLIRTHSVTVLPSVESLKVLRGKSIIAEAPNPLIGFADPLFNPDRERLAQNTSVAADVTAARGIRGTVADLAALKTALPPLPETANELREVAASVHADPADVVLGPAATVTRVKQEKLDQFRIVYFATHGLLAGDVAQFARLNAEPALVLSLPAHPTEFDDGLLTASEVAQLKLNADWVVLSACNTASAEKPGAEALSGLARAFFYAGARSLIVSNWEVDSDSAVALMVGTFKAFAAHPTLSHAQALQRSMLTMLDSAQHPQWADPKYWAPFIVVGEPAKSAN